MQRRIKPLALVGCVLGSACAAAAQNTAPEVSNITVSQRGGTRLVDIYYTLADADGDACKTWVVVSDDGGTTWDVPAISFTGDLGEGITPGAGKHVVWDAGKDMPGRVGSFRVRVWADDDQGPAPLVLVPAGWSQYKFDPDTSAVPVYLETFLIDKYEITNAFYCEFLNNADPNGDHYTSNMASEITQLGTAGNYYYSVVDGFENYPVRYTSRVDAEAFAAWRSLLEGLTYRLPTEEEWQKAAAWDPDQEILWTYGFQNATIDCSWCNYDPSPDCVGRSTEVGHYDGTGGTNDAGSYYGCYDMSGNVREWTSGVDGSNGVLRGGAWYYLASNVEVASRSTYTPASRGYYYGFRLVLDSD